MRRLLNASVALFAMTAATAAAPFQEITVGIPVPSLTQAVTWYTNFLGPDTEVIKPFPGVVEFKVGPDVWIQLFESDNQQPSGAIIRFLVDDMASAQRARAKVGIDTGEAITIPDTVTYTEFADPFGNALGLYDLP